MTDYTEPETDVLEHQEPWRRFGGRGGAARRRIVHAVNILTDALDRRNTYRYKNINYNEEIRVLKIYPGAPGTPILCCLQPCPLFDQTLQAASGVTESIPYAALSYYWGLDDPENTIFMFENDRAYEEWRETDTRRILLETELASRMLIRDNLKDALEHLRSEESPTLLWADALCINQKNTEERTAQVSRMHDVYTQAHEVCIWLGKGEEVDNVKTFAFLNKILDLHELEKLVDRLDKQSGDGLWQEDRQDCKRAINLMRAKWFSRRWVIQELALARNAYVIYGSCKMSWLDFADSIALFMTKFQHIRRAFPTPTNYVAARSSEDYHIGSLDARALGANVLVTATSNLFRKSSQGRIVQRLLSLELLVSSMLLAFEATDPRDTVFAVLQIAKDAPAHKQRSLGMFGILLRYTAPWIGIILWKLYDSNLTYSGNTKSPTSDIALRNMVWSVLDSGNGMFVLFIYCLLLILSMAVVWLLCRMLVNWMVKKTTSVASGSTTNNGPDKRIGANYRKCLRDVCADFIEYCIEDSNSLNIICRHWAPKPRPSPQNPRSSQNQVDMPSWILPITGNAFGGPDQVRRGRVNGDSFVGSEKGGNYTACGCLPPQFEFGKIARAKDALAGEVMQEPGDYTRPPAPETLELAPRYDGTLSVKGFQLGSIETTAPMIGGVISRGALELCGWSKETGASDGKLDQVWRILVANRGPNGTNPPNWYRRACKACLEWYNRLPEDTFNTNDLIRMKETPTGKVEFLDRVQQVVWNRNIVRTQALPSQTSRPYIGVAPRESQRGDVVCILFGCSVPVVLQKQLNGDYKFIGECYMHGVMDGEAVDPMLEGVREQWFRLR